MRRNEVGCVVEDAAGARLRRCARATVVVVPSQHGERVRLEWGADGLEALGPAADIIVIIDVLSFSTCVEIATSRGAVVYPYLHRDESARSFAADRGAALAGRRGEAEYSLSPASLAELDAGQRLVLPSPNGSTIALAAKRYGHVLAGSLRNARAVAAACRALGGTVAIIAAGERWPTGGLRPAIEDALGAGAIASYLEPASCSPEARAAAAAFLGESPMPRRAGTSRACSSMTTAYPSAGSRASTRMGRSGRFTRFSSP